MQGSLQECPGLYLAHLLIDIGEKDTDIHKLEVLRNQFRQLLGPSQREHKMQTFIRPAFPLPTCRPSLSHSFLPNSSLSDPTCSHHPPCRQNKL